MSRMQDKRRRTAEGIVRSAASMFAVDGYAGTTVEGIARAAGVSPGTVYNYFGTKAAILAVVVGGEIVEVFETARSTLVVEDVDAIDVFRHLLEPVAGKLLAYDRELLRAVFRSAYEPQPKPGTDDLVDMDLHVMAELAGIIGTMQSAGSISSNAPPMGAAVLVYSSLAMAMLMYISIPGVTPEAVLAQMDAQLEMMVAGLAPR